MFLAAFRFREFQIGEHPNSAIARVNLRAAIRVRIPTAAAEIFISTNGDAVRTRQSDIPLQNALPARFSFCLSHALQMKDALIVHGLQNRNVE